MDENNPYISNNQQPKINKPFYQKWWFWVIALFIVIAIMPSGVSKSDYERALLDLQTLQSEHEITLGSHSSLIKENTTLKSNYDKLMSENADLVIENKRISEENSGLNEIIASSSEEANNTESSSQNTSAKPASTPPSQSPPAEQPAAQEEPPAPQPTPVQEPPAPAQAPAATQPQAQGVFYTKTGSKYHYKNPCGNGTYYPCTLDEAIAKGLSPCDKCVN